MDLNNSLKQFCKYILKYDNKFNDLSGQEFAGFKRANAKSYNILLENLDNKQIFVNNLNTSLVLLFCKAKVDEITDESYTVLDILIKRNPNFGMKGTLGTVSIDKLKQIKSTIDQQYSNEQDSETRSATTTNRNDVNNRSQEHSLLRKSALNNIRDLYKRIHRKKNNVRIIEYHEKNGSVPSKLFIERFPTPFLIHDIIFVEGYNDIIKECQKKIMTFCKKRLEEQVEALEKDIAKNKSKLEGSDNLEDEISRIEKETIDTLLPSFQKSMEKAERINIRTFVHKESSPNTSLDEDFFSENENTPTIDLTENAEDLSHHKSNRGNINKSLNSSGSYKKSNFRQNGQHRQHDRTRNNRESSFNFSRPRSYSHFRAPSNDRSHSRYTSDHHGHINRGERYFHPQNRQHQNQSFNNSNYGERRANYSFKHNNSYGGNNFNSNHQNLQENLDSRPLPRNTAYQHHLRSNDNNNNTRNSTFETRRAYPNR